MSKYNVRRELAAWEATSEELMASWQRQARDEAEQSEAWESEAGYRAKLSDKSNGY